MMRTGIVVGFAGLLAAAVPGAGALYAYVPGIVSVTGPDSADGWLDDMEAAFGVDSAPASEDPIGAERPDLRRVDRTAKVLEKHWQRLDRTCDPAAVFALLYLETTYTVRDHIAVDYFDDNPHLAIVTVAFIQLYFDAWPAWAAGDLDEVPGPWREAFEAGESRTTSVSEDMFLGINAHVNYDLAIAMWQTGLEQPDGTSRKPDHDRINPVLLAASPRANHRIADYYDATKRPSSDSSKDPYAHTVLFPIYEWRELAWQNAVALTHAPDDAGRAAILADMDAHGTAMAQPFQSPKLSDPWPGRLAYCQANP